MHSPITRPKLVGIVNVTPDSFSDGGAYDAPEAALMHAKVLIEQGADILDIGAESTRPNATPLTPKQEWERLSPIWGELVAMAHAHNVRVSLDSYHAETMHNALAIGCDIINDVSGGADAPMLDMLREHRCDIVVMHSLTIPADKHIVVDKNSDIIKELISFFESKTLEYKAAGIAPSRLMLDPGIGFGKSSKQSLEILLRITELRVLGLPLYLGHSRKSFLTLFSDAPADARDALTLAFSAQAAAAEIAYLRVHNVAAHSALFDAMGL